MTEKVYQCLEQVCFGLGVNIGAEGLHAAFRQGIYPSVFEWGEEER